VKHLTILAVSLLALAACNKSEPAPESAPSAAVESPMPSAEPVASAEAPEVDDLGDIPTPEDFEEEAIEDITADNMEKELDRLEAEIGG
jgi:hypothetical protein